MKRDLYSLLFKWHFIGGILTLPFIALLSITGIIYLFKSDYNKAYLDDVKYVEAGTHKISFDEQLQIAKENWDLPVQSVVVPDDKSKATEFVSGRFSHKSSIYVNPYTGTVNGQVILKNTFMNKVRKLHGELLGGSIGTKVIELVASWMVILLLSGIYLFYPRERGVKGLFFIRTNVGRRTLFRDLHALMGFWFSGLLLLILAGGLPWTDVFGASFKWVQAKTNTGFPVEWSGRTMFSEEHGEAMTLDEMMELAESASLPGEVSVLLPQTSKSVFSLSTSGSSLKEIKMQHYDQYSGTRIIDLSWVDIGVLMQARLWVMAFHQGQFGLWNWYLVLITAVVLLLLSLSAVLSYINRKSKGNLSVPKASQLFEVPTFVKMIIVIFSIILPLFGLSILFILAYEKLKNSRVST